MCESVRGSPAAYALYTVTSERVCEYLQAWEQAKPWFVT